MDKHPFQILLELTDHRAFAYSGRGMYGNKCLAIDLPHSSTLGPFFAEVFDAMMEEHSGRPPIEVQTAFSSALSAFTTDSLGRGIVVYFPGVSFTENEEDDDDSDDD